MLDKEQSQGVGLVLEFVARGSSRPGRGPSSQNGSGQCGARDGEKRRATLGRHWEHRACLGKHWEHHGREGRGRDAV